MDPPIQANSSEDVIEEVKTKDSSLKSCWSKVEQSIPHPQKSIQTSRNGIKGYKTKQKRSEGLIVKKNHQRSNRWNF